jgi:Protein of unknown function (DUF3750)
MTLLLLFAILFLLPLAVATARHLTGDRIVDWRNADRSSAGLLPPALPQTSAVVRIFSARTVRWRGIVATHSWIVIKDTGGTSYSRFDYTAWGEPIWVDRFIPDGRWFGRMPELVFAADGAKAERMIPLIREAIRGYAYPNIGDYRAWPGPNSNTFVAAIIAAVPGMRAALPPTAVGKDFPIDRRWVGLTPSRTGIRLNLGGYLGIAIGWVEGFEVNLLSAVAGIDIRRPAIKLPGLGRLGLPSASWT